MANIWQEIHDHFAGGLFEWNIYTTILLTVLFGFFVYPALFSPEPDTHPLLLARQSAGSRVRQPGESAVFRSLDTPHSYPLRSGLNVRDPGQPKWTAGSDGDLRDIWKRAASGPVDKDGNPTGQAPGKVSVVLGKEEVIEYDFKKLTEEINAVGIHLQKNGGKKVAIYLANSVELLVTLFTCAFYGLTPILVPQQQPLNRLVTLLKETEADTIVVGAGAISLTDLVKSYNGLKQVVWVVARTSRHMDWHEVPEGEGGKASISVWHEIIEENGKTSDLPSNIPRGASPPIILTAAKADSEHEVVKFSQENIVAAVSAQLAVLPRSYTSIAQHHLNPSDTVLSLAPLTDIYPLTITLAALFANASLALTSVSGPNATYASAFQGGSPNILIALPHTLSKLCEDNEATISRGMSRYLHSRKLQTLKSGSMPKSSAALRDVRLIYTYSPSNKPTEVLTTSELNNIRLFTGARVIYAHTVSNVAGAVSQTNMLDYHSNGLNTDSPSHIGVPLSCLEVKLKAAEGQEIDDNKPTGKLFVSGPAVVGGETLVSEVLTMTENNTFAYES